MPFVTISESPLNPDVKPVEIYYREYGQPDKLPLIFLHSGWGYQIYPFDRQIEQFGQRFRILIPDRSGYGRTSQLSHFPPDFHHCAAVETFNFIEALKLDRVILWGHSDGAVISAIMGLQKPAGFAGIIMEAIHLYREKLASRQFFENMVTAPEEFGQRVNQILAQEHGDSYWRQLLSADGQAWLRIAAESNDPAKDFYHNRLGQLCAPALFIHGSADPRTEAAELLELQSLFPPEQVEIIPGGGHSPHSSKDYYPAANQAADRFFQKLGY